MPTPEERDAMHATQNVPIEVIEKCRDAGVQMEFRADGTICGANEEHEKRFREILATYKDSEAERIGKLADKVAEENKKLESALTGTPNAEHPKPQEVKVTGSTVDMTKEKPKPAWPPYPHFVVKGLMGGPKQTRVYFVAAEGAEPQLAEGIMGVDIRIRPNEVPSMKFQTFMTFDEMIVDGKVQTLDEWRHTFERHEELKMADRIRVAANAHPNSHARDIYNEIADMIEQETLDPRVREQKPS